MRFRLQTLADITNTGARRGEGAAYHQEQNYMTVVQTISLRANPTNIKITNDTASVGNMPFGKAYKGKQCVWTMDFEIEFEGGVTEQTLVNDFDMVPFATKLEETVEFEKGIFHTQNNDYNNIFFEQLDK